MADDKSNNKKLDRYTRKAWGSVRAEAEGEGVVLRRVRFDPMTGEREEDESERLQIDALLARRARLVARYEAQLAELDDRIALYRQLVPEEAEEPEAGAEGGQP